MKQSRETTNEGIILKRQKINSRVYRAQTEWNAIERHSLEDYGHLQAEEAENVWHRRQKTGRNRKKVQKQQREQAYRIIP